MKFNKIILFFMVALPFSVALRFLQLFYITESETGFFRQEFVGSGYAILVCIFAFAAATAVFSLFTHRSPEKPPKTDILLTSASLCLAITVIAELIFGVSSFGAIFWQISLLWIFGVATAAWLIIFGIKDYINFSLPNITFVIPVIYFILKIICNFTAISSLALISDNILLIGSYCIILLFFLNFAKLYNNLDTERGFRKLLATGLASIILCFTQSVPNIVFHLTSKNGYLHTSMVTNFNVLFIGVFITIFVFSHFKYSNACK